MAKYCADCTHYNIKKPKKPGLTGMCMCAKQKKFMLASTPRCDKFEEAHSRGWYEREKLYDDGKKIFASDRTAQLPWFTPVILAVIATLAKLFGFI